MVISLEYLNDANGIGHRASLPITWSMICCRSMASDSASRTRTSLSGDALASGRYRPQN